MGENRPFIITFIGDGFILSAFLVILSLFPEFIERFGIRFEPLPTLLQIPILPAWIMKILAASILLIISYGYLRLKRWGYWLMVSVHVYFLAAWIVASLQSGQQSVYQNPIAIIIGLIFILPTIKYFNRKTFTS
ncbi:MAG: hypothetical protein K0R93_3409 [Anaerosolibacter sp.]|jgi:hypothetical protein|uniref:hypothetical protein n=1 Tax=Anaerosolibacter sp. TaxID=1872527 RepID=UPI00261A0B05|nr:hypothetical protein [Anaerosolibacter sp.]MDF2548511.1 hypothetical protein [Anaerosolibacter sp.]